MLVFFLTRTWLSEPNVVPAAAAGADPHLARPAGPPGCSRPSGSLPLLFTVFNASPLHLLWLPRPAPCSARWPVREARRRDAARPRRAGRGLADRRLVDRRHLPAAAGRRRSPGRRRLARGGGRHVASAASPGGAHAASRARLPRSMRSPATVTSARRVAAGATRSRLHAKGPAASLTTGATWRRRASASACPSSNGACRRCSPGPWSWSSQPDAPWDEVTATFGLDLVERLAGGGGTVVEPRLALRRQGRAGRAAPAAAGLRGPLTAVSACCGGRFGLRTTYEPTEPVAHPRGDLRHRRRRRPARRRGSTSPACAVRAVTEVIVMNEQGARTLRPLRATPAASS